MAKIILLIVQLGVIGFLLFYGLPQLIKSRRKFKKQLAEINKEMEETRNLLDLCLPILKGTATDIDIALFLANKSRWEENHGKVVRIDKVLRCGLGTDRKDFS